MDRENLWAPGWSHVLSTTNDIAELSEFCARVGAPPSALHLGNRRWPHLDLKLVPRERALVCPEVRVFDRTSDMLRFLKRLVGSRVESSVMQDTNRGARKLHSVPRIPR